MLLASGLLLAHEWVELKVPCARGSQLSDSAHAHGLGGSCCHWLVTAGVAGLLWVGSSRHTVGDRCCVAMLWYYRQMPACGLATVPQD